MHGALFIEKGSENILTVAKVNNGTFTPIFPTPFPTTNTRP
jgi:hypothetical protein